MSTAPDAPPLPASNFDNARADDHYGATDRPRPGLTLSLEATLAPARDRAVTVEAALRVLRALVLLVIGPLAVVEVDAFLAKSSAWARMQATRDRGLRYLSSVARDCALDLSADEARPLYELALLLDEASTGVSMLAATEPPSCLAGAVATRADVAPRTWTSSPHEEFDIGPGGTVVRAAAPPAGEAPLAAWLCERAVGSGS